LNFLSRAQSVFALKGDFREAFLEAITIILNLEEEPDVLSLIMEVSKEIIGEGVIEDEVRYLMIESLHMKLYSNHFGVKRSSLSLIFTLTYNNHSDFIYVFKKMVERCIETQNQDLVLIFLQTLSSIKGVPYSNEIYRVILDVVMSPLFSSTKESILYVLKFVEHLF